MTKELEEMFDDTLRQFFIAFLRIKYNIKRAEFINNDTAIVIQMKDTDEVKYITPQFFDYETEKFVFNRDTFGGEVGVVIMTRSYVAVFNRDVLTETLKKYKKYIKKNKYGDWEIEWGVVKNIVQKIAENEPKE